MTEQHKADVDRQALRDRFVEDESGIAMLLVIGMAVVLLLTATVGLNITDSAIDRSAKHVTFEAGAHMAERGIDLALARLQQDKTWATPGTSTTLAMTATPTEEEAWAKAELAIAPVVDAGDGEWAVVKPTGRNVVYAASWMPDRATATRPRFFKSEYLFSTYSAPGAILTGGNLKIGGNAKVTGSLGSVHSNGNIDIVGGSLTVEKGVTAVGTLSGGLATWSGGQPQKTIPEVNPRDIYDVLSDDDPGNWYDLCPDSKVRKPSTSGPCTGDVLNETGDFRGWKHITTGGKNVWKSGSTTPYDGVYYAYRSAIEVAAKTSAPWKTTLIAEGTPTTGCMQDLGDIKITGHPNIVGYLGGLALVAGRDLEIAGTPSGNTESYTGLLAANEQIKVTGTPNLVGALIAGDHCQTPGSPVDESYVSGDMIITYNNTLNTSLVPIIRSTLWAELE